jgi:Flp pilus assembly protein TadG
MDPVTRWHSERGAEIVELALVLPILMLVLGGIVDFGFLFKNYEVVTNAAREGARFAVVPTVTAGDVESRVDTFLSAGGLVPANATVTVDNVSVAIDSIRSVSAVRVGVLYPHTYMVLGPLMQLVGAAPLGTTPLRAAATMRHEVAATP